MSLQIGDSVRIIDVSPGNPEIMLETIGKIGKVEQTVCSFDDFITFKVRFSDVESDWWWYEEEELKKEEKEK